MASELDRNIRETWRLAIECSRLCRVIFEELNRRMEDGDG